MDRRSFVIALFGGAVATAAGTYCSVANAAPVPAPSPEPEALDLAASEHLDQAEAEFAQYYGGRPIRRGPPPHARGWGPPGYRRGWRRPPPGYYRRRRYYRDRW